MEKDDNENGIGTPSGLGNSFANEKSSIGKDATKKIGKEAAKKGGKAAGKLAKLGSGPIGWIIAAAQFIIEKPKTASSLVFIGCLLSSILLILFYSVFSYFPSLLLSFENSAGDEESLIKVYSEIKETMWDVETDVKKGKEEEALEKFSLFKKENDETETEEGEYIYNVINIYKYKEEVADETGIYDSFEEDFVDYISRHSALIYFGSEIDKSYDSFIEKAIRNITGKNSLTVDDYKNSSDGFFERLREYLEDDIIISDVSSVPLSFESESEEKYEEREGETIKIITTRNTEEISLSVSLKRKGEEEFLEKEIDDLIDSLLEVRNKKRIKKYTREEVEKEVWEYIENSKEMALYVN